MGAHIRIILGDITKVAAPSDNGVTDIREISAAALFGHTSDFIEVSILLAVVRGLLWSSEAVLQMAGWQFFLDGGACPCVEPLTVALQVGCSLFANFAASNKVTGLEKLGQGVASDAFGGLL